MTTTNAEAETATKTWCENLCWNACGVYTSDLAL